MEFIIDRYVASHGKNPKGLGSWAFCDVKHSDRNDYLSFVVWSPSMTLTEAKKWAKNHPVLKQSKYVDILP